MKIGPNTRIWHPEKSVLLEFTCGQDCVIHAPVWIGNNVFIGNRVKIQAFAFIPEGVRIDDDVFIGPGVTFTNDFNPPSNLLTPTVVSRSAVIGANSTIVCGVVIGVRAMIGAGSVVTRDIPPHEKWSGNPARPM